MADSKLTKFESFALYFSIAAAIGMGVAIGQDMGVRSTEEKSWLVQFSDAVHCTIAPKRAQRDICSEPKEQNKPTTPTTQP